MSTFHNPVLPGMNPDPSICAVREEYFLVTSSFAYWPAIPVHRSRDLVRWEPIGHVLDRAEQIDLNGLEMSDGIWAPTIRHHEGIFYVVFTVARDRRGSVNFVTTATDAAGPWTQPVILDAEGIDPSLFFDDDGRCWFTACRDAEDPTLRGPAELYLQELDLHDLRLIGQVHVLWNGALSGAWVEAPHIYKREGIYHLIAAEGGTERNHAVTAARSTSVTGPYRTDPRSPLLTHRHLGESATIQNVGHADLVDTPAGETWALVLGTRPIDGAHTLGREVFLVPATWTDDGLVLAPGKGRVTEVERRPLGPYAEEARLGSALPERERFANAGLPCEWRSLRGPVREHSGAPGEGLSLIASVDALSSSGTPTFVARRQEHHRFEAKTCVSFQPETASEEAGLAVFQDSGHYATLAVSRDEYGKRIVRFRRSDVSGTSGEVALSHDGDAVLRVIGDDDAYVFSCWHDRECDWLTLGKIPRAWFSTEHAGGFVGVHVGVHATGASEKGSRPARFSWFEYAPRFDSAKAASHSVIAAN
ncbi:glycoside hydrolase family 43 protein (plasmid) [Clavibacter capsici]|uniref:Glycoside hydrolase family 43 protein n=1 Tax=Clavibacter capsici TaxID=1874630 RepID=A0A0M3RS37_9MICO|nr:glycoside hydrolase family 43 protein [Clavibacter capsici]ALD14395.1 xylosidase [Clavibacter capsici]QIS40529.1 glycoside hydrolase family 43 protein [Clavibacter capsici]QIS43541.1 glycoside hydrolase family 43 protein [Clavibacter capsici]QIS46413.1 glycoside hydrolase family 43 protein [Clavibacter capsici]